jgi:hypothetical protein
MKNADNDSIALIEYLQFISIFENLNCEYHKEQALQKILQQKIDELHISSEIELSNPIKNYATFFDFCQQTMFLAYLKRFYNITDKIEVEDVIIELLDEDSINRQQIQKIANLINELHSFEKILHFMMNIYQENYSLLFSLEKQSIINGPKQLNIINKFNHISNFVNIINSYISYITNILKIINQLYYAICTFLLQLNLTQNQPLILEIFLPIFVNNLYNICPEKYIFSEEFVKNINLEIYKQNLEIDLKTLWYNKSQNSGQIYPLDIIHFKNDILIKFNIWMRYIELFQFQPEKSNYIIQKLTEDYCDGNMIYYRLLSIYTLFKANSHFNTKNSVLIKQQFEFLENTQLKTFMQKFYDLICQYNHLDLIDSNNLTMQIEQNVCSLFLNMQNNTTQSIKLIKNRIIHVSSNEKNIDLAPKLYIANFNNTFNKILEELNKINNLHVGIINTDSLKLNSYVMQFLFLVNILDQSSIINEQITPKKLLKFSLSTITNHLNSHIFNYQIIDICSQIINKIWQLTFLTSQINIGNLIKEIIMNIIIKLQFQHFINFYSLFKQYCYLVHNMYTLIFNITFVKAQIETTGVNQFTDLESINISQISDNIITIAQSIKNKIFNESFVQISIKQALEMSEYVKLCDIIFNKHSIDILQQYNISLQTLMKEEQQNKTDDTCKKIDNINNKLQENLILFYKEIDTTHQNQYI